MLPLGKQPSSRYNQPCDETESLTSASDLPGAPSPAVNAILGRLGLARESDEPEGNEARLARALTDPSATVRVEATQKLGKMGKHAPLELLVVALSDEQSSVRAASARALGRNPRPAAISALVKALEDTSWVVRAEAALSLGKMGELVPLEPLFAATHDAEDAAVRAAALTALGEIGAEHARELFNAALQDEDWSVREAATLALARLQEREQLTPPSILLLHPQQASPSRQSTETHAPAARTEDVLSSSSLTRWRERIAAFQAELAQNAQATNLLAPPVHGEHQSPARSVSLDSRRKLWPIWSPRGMHITEGLLILFLIGGLILGALAAALALAPHQYFASSLAAKNQPGSEPFTTYRGHMSSVIKAAWSPNGQTVASADTRGTVNIWDARTGHTLMTYPQRGAVLALAWSTNNMLLIAYGEPTRSLQVEELTLNEASTVAPAQLIFQRAGLPGIPSVADWAANQQILAFDTGNGTVEIWNVMVDLHLTDLQLPHARYSKLLWSPEVLQLATLTTSGQLQVWDGESGQNIATLTGNQRATLATWAPASQENGKESLFFVTADGTVMHWQYMQPSAPVTPFISPSVYNGADLQDITLTALAVSPNGEQLLLATSNGDVQARDASTGNLVYFYQGHSAQVNDIAWTPDGQHIVTASQDRTVQIWQEP